MIFINKTILSFCLSDNFSIKMEAVRFAFRSVSTSFTCPHFKHCHWRSFLWVCGSGGVTSKSYPFLHHLRWVYINIFVYMAVHISTRGEEKLCPLWTTISTTFQQRFVFFHHILSLPQVFWSTAFCWTPRCAGSFTIPSSSIGSPSRFTPESWNDPKQRGVACICFFSCSVREINGNLMVHNRFFCYYLYEQ